MVAPTSIAPAGISDDSIDLGDGRYVQLLEPIGKGGAGTVYRGALAGRFGLQRLVAVKVFDRIASEDTGIVADALARASRHSAYVAHPNVAAVYAFSMTPRREPLVVSELVPGCALDVALATLNASGRRIAPDLALFVTIEVAEGLAGARRAIRLDGRRLNMAHHDLSMREVRLSVHGEVKTTDFGVGRAMRQASRVMSMAELAKRAVTLAPEVARGEPSTARSDVFALGLMMRELLVGRRFSDRVSETEIVRRAREGDFDEPTIAPRLPDAVRVVMRRCLEIDPRARYADAAELLDQLRHAAFSLGVSDGRFFLRRLVDEILQARDVDRSESGVRSAHAEGA